MANVNEVDAATVAVTTWTEMTNDDVAEGVAVTATCTAAKIVIRAGTAATATVTMTVGMITATATQEVRALSRTIALQRGLQPHHPGPPLGARVPHTMTTLGDMLPRHHHLKMTDLEGQIHHLRMVPQGVCRKTCTEGTVGWTEGLIILNSKWLFILACQKPS